PPLMESTKHTCLKLEIPNADQTTTDPIFVRATWFPSRFDLSISDGLNAWTLNAAEDEVRERASQWDQPVSEYIELAERHLGFQQPGSVYGLWMPETGTEELDEVVWKTQSFDKLRVEAEKCLAQSERFSNEKTEFEDAIYAKFLGVLNSKKAKLRELRDRLSKQEKSGKLPEEKRMKNQQTKQRLLMEVMMKRVRKSHSELTGTSKNVSSIKPRGRKRK
ncbi:hypothetical protein C3L33_15035, partial [Rhododendron williamsianum]